MLIKLEEKGIEVLSTFSQKNGKLYEKINHEINADIFEIVRPKYLFKQPIVLCCDEEGGLKKKNYFNPIASYAYGFCEHGNPIVGDVLIMKETNAGTDLEELNKKEVSILLTAFDQGRMQLIFGALANALHIIRMEA